MGDIRKIKPTDLVQETCSADPWCIEVRRDGRVRERSGLPGWATWFNKPYIGGRSFLQSNGNSDQGTHPDKMRGEHWDEIAWLDRAPFSSEKRWRRWAGEWDKNLVDNDLEKRQKIDAIW